MDDDFEESLKNVDLTPLEALLPLSQVFKVSLPVDTITPELTINDGEVYQKLHSVEKISSIFDEALVDEHVHILVQVPTGALHIRFIELS